MALTHDTQAASDTCDHCGAVYDVRRGSLYRDGVPVALYLGGMHSCQGDPIIALGLALAPSDGGSGPEAVTVRVWSTPDEYQMTFVEPQISPWRGHSYLGRMLTPDEARATPRGQQFLELADYLLTNDPYLRDYLGN